MAISCQSFSDYLSRKTEHLDDLILSDLTPTNTLIGSVQTGKFSAEDGVSHTFDKFNRVFPDMSGQWEDVGISSCIGAPCDPSETKIGFGFTRDSYKLQRKSYATDLFCYDLILSADRAKQQFTQIIGVLRDATKLINDNRIRNEYFRISGLKWACTPTGLVPITFTETGDLITVTPSTMPTADLVPSMLQSRLDYQILAGATGQVDPGSPPVLEVSTDSHTIRNMIAGDGNIITHWRFEDFDVASKEFNMYGWTGRVGNFMLKADLHPIRFQIVGNTLRRVFPYTNIAATEGIRGIPNQDYINAPVQISFIWHRKAMMALMRDTTSINPMMPFAARDFGGKWFFAMDNLTCGTAQDANGLTIPIAVDNARRNKGKFLADFSYATQAQFPEYAESFLHLRANQCIQSASPCGLNLGYATQNYSSANTPC